MIALYTSNGRGVIQEFETAPNFEHIDVTNVDLTAYENPTIVNGQIVNGEQMPIEIPTTITPLQFWRSVYKTTGLTEEFIIGKIEETIPEPPKVEILIMLRKAIEFERYNPQLVQMAGNFGIDNETLNQIFINA